MVFALHYFSFFWSIVSDYSLYRVFHQATTKKSFFFSHNFSLSQLRGKTVGLSGEHIEVFCSNSGFFSMTKDERIEREYVRMEYKCDFRGLLRQFVVCFFFYEKKIVSSTECFSTGDFYELFVQVQYK